MKHGLASKSGNDSFDENHLYDAFNRIDILSRPYVSNPFMVKSFNLVEAFEIEKLKNDNKRII